MDWQWHSDPDLRPLAEVWRAAEETRAGSVFQSYAFAQQWARCFAGEAELRIAWRASPPLIVPLVVRRGRLEFMGEGLFDYLDVIGAAGPGLEREAAELALGLGWPKAQFTGVVDTPHLTRVAPVGRSAPWLRFPAGGARSAQSTCKLPPAAATRLGEFWRALGAEAQPFAIAPVRAAGAALDGEHRRLEARWRRATPALRRETEAGPRRQVLAWLLDHKARALAGRGEANALGAAEQRWVTAMVEHEPALCELWTLERGGRRLSALLAWRNRGARYGYTLSYEEDAAELSPGILLLFAVVRHTMNEGRSFHFLTGEHAYKQRFATHGEPLLRYVLVRS